MRLLRTLWREATANPEREMPFTHHLEELRWHLLRALLYLAIAFSVAWHFFDPIYTLITTPVRHAFHNAGLNDGSLVYMDVLEPLFFRLNVCFWSALIIGLPLILWEVWRFIAPGLHKHERRYVAPLLPFSILLCFAGFTLVYYALPMAFEFLLRFAGTGGGTQVFQHLQKYAFFLLRMMLGTALVFQSPLVLLLLGQLELVTARGLLTYWRHAVFVCFTIAAIITPTIDPVNMSVIGLPMVGLYFMSIGLVWWVERSRARRAARRPEEPGDGPDNEHPLPPDDEPPAPPPPPPPTADDEPAPPVIDRSVLGPLAIKPPEAEGDGE